MDRETRLAEILGEWYERRERGETVDPETVVREHPDLAEELRARFAALELVDLALERPDAAGPPDRIGPYRLLEELGAGGMGTVYLAEIVEPGDVLDAGRRVALKLVHPHLLRSRGFFKRFLREAEAGRQVRHENVVRTFEADALEVEGRPVHFLVMEYVEGRTLDELLRGLGTVPEALVREIGRQIVAGLAAIHAKGIVHRDLKPENVLITEDHAVRIMDLGVARLVDASVGLTREGQFAGSLPYASPEQFRGEEVGPAADLYSLGVVLYELATGQNPFRREGAAAVMRAHVEDVPPAADEIHPDVSPFLSAVLGTLLGKDPAERFPDATSLGEVLEEGEGSTWWTSRERALRRSRPRVPRVPVRRETRLHGRGDDLALLREAWGRAREGDGGTVLVEGEAGIGKSRLVDAFLQELGDRDARVLYGSYAPSGGLGGLSDAILEHFGEHDLEAALAPYLSATPAIVPAFASLLRHEGPGATGAPLSGDGLPGVFVQLTRRLAEERPLLWVVEDLHFADPDHRRLLLAMARAVEGQRVLLLLSTRPEIPESELAHLARIPSFRRTRLGRLSAREVVLLLRDAFRSEALADKLGARIALKSDGVPFFVFEVIRGLREGQFITELPDGSFVETREIERIEVPSAVRDLIEARLRDLTKEERALLDVGAVQGFEFDPDLVARAIGRPRIAVLQDLADLDRRSGVVRSHGEAYRFDHHQIQEVLYVDLPPGLKREYHGLTAREYAAREGLEGVDVAEIPGETACVLARHHLRGTDPARAEPQLLRALRHLVDSYRNEAAIELADLALASTAFADERLRTRILIGKGNGLRILSRHAVAEPTLREAVEAADALGDPLLRAQARRFLGISLTGLGSYDEARAELRSGLELARKAGDFGEQADAACALGVALHYLTELSEARKLYEQGIELARRGGSPESEARSRLSLAALLWDLGHGEEALEQHERSLALFREAGSRRGEVWAIGHVANSLALVGRNEEAMAVFEETFELCRERGDRDNEMFFSGHRADLLRALGRLGEALGGYERFLEGHREKGKPYWTAHAEQIVGQIRAVLGDSTTAEAHTRESLRLFREIRDEHGEGVALRQLGQLADWRDDRTLALEVMEEGLAKLRNAGVVRDLQEALHALASMRADAGNSEVAVALFREAEATGGSDALALQAAVEAAILMGEEAPLEELRAGLLGSASHEERMSMCFLLWRAAGDPADLAEAHRLLEELRASAPEEYRESMVENVRLHRDIARAWTARSGAGATSP